MKSYLDLKTFSIRNIFTAAFLLEKYCLIDKKDREIDKHKTLPSINHEDVISSISTLEGINSIPLSDPRIFSSKEIKELTSLCHLNGLNQDEINLSELVELYDESVSQNEKDKLILYIEQSINKIKEIDKLSLEEQILDPFYFLIKAGNKRLLSKRLGLDGDDPLTLEETSELWPKKISRQRVQQIEAKFLKQINLKKFYIPKFDDLISELKPMLPLSQDKLIKFFSSQNEKILL